MQEFSLILSNFIMSNAVPYDKSNSSISFTVRLHCVIQYMPRNTIITFVSEIYLRKVYVSKMSMF